MKFQTRRFCSFALFALIAGVLFCSISAQADDLTPPRWRFQPGTTYQHWEFPTPNGGPPDKAYNPYGMPWLTPQCSVWLPTDEGQTRIGMFGLLPGETLSFEVPNRREPNFCKFIWLQVTFRLIPGTPLPGVFVNPDAAGGAPIYTRLEDGWIHGLWKFRIPFNPPCETITIVGGVALVDQVVIDTACVPEPASLAGLGTGLIGLLGLLRRKR